ncbi:MAG: hypothetical protein WC898_02555 [Candidatus Paceibacterota bacterium]|jgi:hypothetical protein
MKKLLFILVFFSFVCASAQTKMKKFLSLPQLQEAVDLGTVNFYEPQFLSGHKSLADGEDTISFPYPTGVKMTVVGGHYWVLQKPGTVFVVKKGETTPIRRLDCGNKISGFFVFYPARPTPAEIKIVKINLNFLNSFIPPPPPPTPTPTPPLKLKDWSTENTVGLISTMALGAIVGGLGFMEVETTNNNQYQFGTTDGENLLNLLSAPGEEQTVFRFNILGAMAGVLVGGILYVLYNWL